MFQLVETQKKRTLSISLGFAVVAMLLALGVVLPLLFPQTLAAANLISTFYAPPPPPADAPPVEVFTKKQSPPPPVKQPALDLLPGVLFTPDHIPPDIVYADPAPPTGVPGGNPNNTGLCIVCEIFKNPADTPEAAPLPPPPPPPAVEKPIRVGGNVQQANLLVRTLPVYPQLAKQARVQGVVVLEAVIGKDGTIKDLRVISGHQLLVPAALDAVSKWVYKPTLLNGEPVEVVTTITVNFAFGQ